MSAEVKINAKECFETESEQRTSQTLQSLLHANISIAAPQEPNAVPRHEGIDTIC
jgi:hypothetical protein